MSAWVFIQSEPGLYTVGHYKPDGKWVPESDHSSTALAADRVHFLNGGERTLPVSDLRASLEEVTDHLWELCKDERDDKAAGITGWTEVHQAVADARKALGHKAPKRRP